MVIENKVKISIERGICFSFHKNYWEISIITVGKSPKTHLVIATVTCSSNRPLDVELIARPNRAAGKIWVKENENKTILEIKK